MDIAECETELKAKRFTWLVTGVAGFIGSNLLERLLDLNQKVVGLDNFSTGKPENLAAVRKLVPASHWQGFKFIEGDIQDLETCREAVQDVDVILHEAALGSVPRSLTDPLATHESNINGFVNMLLAARDAQVGRFIYAASSSTYGDHPDLPKVEDRIGKPLSVYAVTKYVNELYAEVFSHCYGMKTIGLRYFNVFGPRQDPNGAYAAVIPLWFKGVLCHEPAYINGDGETSRDFCYVDNAVQVNLLAALTDRPEALNQIYNVAVGQSTSLNQLFNMIKTEVRAQIDVPNTEPIHREFRPGDIRHSLADISKAKRLLGYQPTHTVAEGIRLVTDYYIQGMDPVSAGSKLKME